MACLPKVSVIIPVYNVEKYLRQCLDSLRNQTLKEIEIICVDDGSTDSSFAILEEYCAADPRIKVLSQKNLFAGAARNNGMKMASGEYLIFLDSDDFFSATLLEKTYRAGKEKDADVVLFGGMRYDDSTGEYLDAPWYFRKSMLPVKNPFSRKDLGGRLLEITSPAPWTKVFKRSYIEALHLEFQVQQNANDAFFVLTAIALAERITYVPENLVFYRIGMKSNLQTKKVKYPCCFLDAYEAVFQKTKEAGIYPEIEKGFVNLALSGCVFNLQTMKDPEIRWIICDRMQKDSFRQMALLDYDDGYYTNIKNKCFLQRALEAYGQSRAEGGQRLLIEEEPEASAKKNAVSQSVKEIAIESVKPAEEKKLPAPVKKTGNAGTGKTIKKVLRRFVPAGRTYIDKKMKDTEKNVAARLEKQKNLLDSQNKILKGLKNTLFTQNEMLRDQNELLQSQKKMLEEQIHLFADQKRMLQFLQKKDEEQLRAISGVKKYIDQELQRRDSWGLRAAQTERLAHGRPVWVIKCPAPEDETKVKWGDYPFALALKRCLEQLNCYVILDAREDWGCEEGADVVVALRGHFFYRPDRRNKKCLYIMWNISHPDFVTKEEYELFDVVCVGSRHYAKQLREKLSVPVFPLLQCTDTEVFYPPANKKDSFQWDYIFIGNSRGVARSCVMWAVEEKLPIRMWGSGWEKILPDHMDLFEAPFIENSQIPDLYRSARVTLNDHWGDMLEKQFVNNRIFDALACGLPVISDVCQELRDIFPDAVLYYSNKEEFRECVRQIEENYEEIRERVLAQWDLIREQYSFEARARELVEIAEKYRSE